MSEKRRIVVELRTGVLASRCGDCVFVSQTSLWGNPQYKCDIFARLLKRTRTGLIRLRLCNAAEKEANRE